MKFNGGTLQEWIWNNMEALSEEPMAVWDWVVVFEHYGLGLKKNKDYIAWKEECIRDGML